MAEFIAYSTLMRTLDLPSSGGIGSQSSYLHMAWAFMVGVEGSILSKISFRLRKVGTPAEDITFAVYSFDPVTNGPGVKLSSDVVIPESSVSDSASAYFDLDFSSDNIELKPQAKYFIVGWVSTASAGNYYRHNYSGGQYRPYKLGGGYSANWAIASSSDGSTWASVGSDLFAQFQVFCTHATTKVLWYNDGANWTNTKTKTVHNSLDNRSLVFRIDVPDDGLYRQLEDMHFQIDSQNAYPYIYERIRIFEVAQDGTSFGDEIDPIAVTGRGMINRADGNTSNQGHPPVISSWLNAEERPILEPNKSYYIQLNNCFNASSMTFYYDDSADTDAFVANNKLERYDDFGKELCPFWIHGKELSELPVYNQDRLVMFGSTWDRDVIGNLELGRYASSKYQIFAFVPSESGYINKIAIRLQTHQAATPGAVSSLRGAIHASSGYDFGSEIRDLGVVADTTDFESTEFGTPFNKVHEIDFSDLAVTAGVKYWLMLWTETTDTANYWYTDRYDDGNGQIGSNISDNKSTGYSSDAASWTYSDYLPAIRIYGTATNGAKSLVNVKSYIWNNPSTVRLRCFYDSTERYVAQKFKTPNVAGKLYQITSLMVPACLGNKYTGDGYGNVWLEIRSVGGGDSIGSIVTNGTSDSIGSNAATTDDAHPGAYVNFAWSTPPELDPNTEYWVVFASDYAHTSYYWSIAATVYETNIRDSLGQDTTLYRLDSSYAKTEVDKYHVFEMIINGVEIDVPIPPPTDFVLDWHLTLNRQRDSILYWLLTNHVEDDFTLKYTITDVKIDEDTVLMWALHLTNDWTFQNILFASHLDTDTILKWKILLSNDTSINWALLIDLFSDNILRWPLTTPLSQDFSLVWKLILSRDWTFVWPITIPVVDTDILKIPIKVENDSMLINAMMGFVDQSMILLNSIGEDGRDAVNRVITLLNEIENKIANDWGIKYNIQVTSDSILIIPLLTRVNKDFVLNYKMLEAVTQDDVIKFNILDYNPVEADAILRNSLLGKPTFYKITFS